MKREGAQQGRLCLYGRTKSIGSLALWAALAAGCSAPPSGVYQGYAEGEYVYVASPYAATLDHLDVARGQQVVPNAPLFRLERAAEEAALREAEARLKTAEARLANLETGRRKAEVDTVVAQKQAAAAARQLATLQLRQQEKLRAAGFVSQSRLDEAKAGYRRDTAQVAESEAQLRNARQSLGREQEIRAARTDVDAAREQRVQAQWRMDRKSAAAPAAALVQDTFYSQGEWVPAGSPVVSLLPPGNIKLRFFVPETTVGAVKVGQPVSAVCDGCGPPITAVVSFVAPQAEYTPPVIYSKESRAKLVFLVEARPRAEDAARLHPGQPVDVSLAAKE
ncbi:MAG: HlyD family efflux transporter periplasmic adaptor subunit [Rhodocyclaceae bacterium]